MSEIPNVYVSTNREGRRAKGKRDKARHLVKADITKKAGVRKVSATKRATSSKQISPTSSSKKGWKRKVDNKLRGSYGQTDFKNKTITINKKASKKSPLYKRPVNKGAKKYPDTLATIVHEEYHRSHPKATEKATRKAERRLVATMTPKQKERMYGRYQKKPSK